MFELNTKFQSRCKNPRFISMAVARNVQIKRVTNSGNSVWSNKNNFLLRERVCLEFTSICSHSAGRADEGSGEPQRYLHACEAPAGGEMLESVSWDFGMCGSAGIVRSQYSI